MSLSADQIKKRTERILIGTTGPVWNIVHKNIVHNS
jgi:hypothetical protein